MIGVKRLCVIVACGIAAAEGDLVNQRERQRLATRQRLAEHALRLFQRRGFDDTTVEQIASAAGVSERTFFLHFPTKAASAFPDHDQRVAGFVEKLGEAADHPNPMQHLCHMMAAGLDVGSPMRRRRYQLLASVAALRDEDARTDRDYEKAVAEYLVGAWGSSPDATLRANAVANATMGVVRASLIAWSETGIDPRDVCLEMLQRMFGSPFDLPLQSLHPIPRRAVTS